MKNRITALALALLTTLCLCACARQDNDVKYDEYRKVADNLYEVTCDMYDYDYLFENGPGNVEYLTGCSAIKEGDFLGRNFDFVAGDAAEIVVRTTAKNDRYASVGMVGGMMWLTSDFMAAGLDEDAKKLIPLMLLDGINEKGLAVESNCVNTADVGGPTLHTNPGKQELQQLCVVRYLLDHAATADEAVELLKNVDVVNGRDVMGLVTKKFETHFLITDSDKTYVVEFDNTKPDGEKMIVMEDETVMTNFYLHLADTQNDIFPGHSMGVERYRKLADHRASAVSVDGMKALMQSIRFSNSNKSDGEYAPGENYSNPYICFSDHPVFGEEEINYGNQKEHIPEILEEMKRNEAITANILNDPNMENPSRLWVTSHSTVFDLANKTMSVAVYERFDHYYEYSAR